MRKKPVTWRTSIGIPAGRLDSSRRHHGEGINRDGSRGAAGPAPAAGPPQVAHGAHLRPCRERVAAVHIYSDAPATLGRAVW
jgi:hypothetical protein